MIALHRFARVGRAVARYAATLALPVAVGSCATQTWTPAQIDSVAAQCQAVIERGKLPASSPYFAMAASPKPAGTPVIVYGASWCSACRIAEDYMRRRGIPYTVADVEGEKGARDRIATLAAAQLPISSTLPVIDVRGTVTVGFMPCVLEKAWAER